MFMINQKYDFFNGFDVLFQFIGTPDVFLPITNSYECVKIDAQKSKI